MLVEITVIAVLIILNGLFSMSEIAVVQARKGRLESAAKRGHHGAEVALNLAAEPTRFLSTVQIGITLVGILNGFFSGCQVSEFLTVWFKSLGVPYAEAVGVFAVVLIITFLSLIFGELLPKRIGMSNPEGIAQAMAPIMAFISRLTAPFIWALTSTTELFIRVFRIRSDANAVTEEEIRQILDEGAIAGAIEEIEQDIVENVLHLGDKRVGSLMTHRSELTWFNADAPLEQIREAISAHQFTCYPVANGSLDEVIGIVFLKDLVPVLFEDRHVSLNTLIKQPIVFPEQVRAWKVLERFKEARQTSALVVDEFGSLQGLVTLRDLLDAIVGDLGPFESEAEQYRFQREDGSWLIDARMPYDDFLKVFDVIDDAYRHTDFYTIGGFILQKLRRIPTIGDKIKWGVFTFEIVDMDGNRVDKVLMTQDVMEEG